MEKGFDPDKRHFGISDPKILLKKYFIGFQRKIIEVKNELDTRSRKFRKDESEFCLDCLEIVDAFENIFTHIKEKEKASSALEPVESSIKKMVMNFESIYRKMLRLLEARGVTPMVFENGVAQMGLCKVISTVENLDRPKGEIVQVIKKGYLKNGEVLRLAEVITRL